MTFRLGLIGLGAWGRRYVETIKRRDDCEIVAFARASSAGGGLEGAIRCDSWQDLVALGTTGGLDGVIVATTPDHQCEVARHAALASVPVLVEKPLGFSARAAASVREAQSAQAQPSPVLVDAVHLFSPAYRALKALVREDPAPITEIRTQGSSRGPFRDWSTLYDFGAHDVSLCVDLIGTDARLELSRAAKLQPADVPGGTIYEADLLLNETRVSIAVGNGAPSKSRLFAVTLGSGRTLVYDDMQPLEQKLTDAGRAVQLAPTMPLDAAISEFIDQSSLWRAGRLNAPLARASVELAVRVLEVLDTVNAAYGS